MLFHMPQKITPQLHLNIKGSPIIENVNEFNFLGLTLDCNLSFKPHTKIIAAKISRVIDVLHKLKYIIPAYWLHMIIYFFNYPTFELLFTYMGNTMPPF